MLGTHQKEQENYKAIQRGVIGIVAIIAIIAIIVIIVIIMEEEFSREPSMV